MDRRLRSSPTKTNPKGFLRLVLVPVLAKNGKKTGLDWTLKPYRSRPAVSCIAHIPPHLIQCPTLSPTSHHVLHCPRPASPHPVPRPLTCVPPRLALPVSRLASPSTPPLTRVLPRLTQHPTLSPTSPRISVSVASCHVSPCLTQCPTTYRPSPTVLPHLTQGLATSWPRSAGRATDCLLPTSFQGKNTQCKYLFCSAVLVCEYLHITFKCVFDVIIAFPLTSVCMQVNPKNGKVARMISQLTL